MLEKLTAGFMACLLLLCGGGRDGTRTGRRAFARAQGRALDADGVLRNEFRAPRALGLWRLEEELRVGGCRRCEYCPVWAVLSGLDCPKPHTECAAPFADAFEALLGR